MASETNETLHTAGDAAAIGGQTASGAESDTMTTSSSSNAAAEKIAN
jgi:hypothetical protein